MQITFKPAEGFTRVEFAAAGGNLVTVPEEGLTVETTEMRDIPVFDEETGEYPIQSVEVEINGNILAALDAHEQVVRSGETHAPAPEAQNTVEAVVEHDAADDSALD